MIQLGMFLIVADFKSEICLWHTLCIISQIHIIFRYLKLCDTTSNDWNICLNTIPEPQGLISIIFESCKIIWFI